MLPRRVPRPHRRRRRIGGGSWRKQPGWFGRSRHDILLSNSGPATVRRFGLQWGRASSLQPGPRSQSSGLARLQCIAHNVSRCMATQAIAIMGAHPRTFSHIRGRGRRITHRTPTQGTPGVCMDFSPLEFPSTATAVPRERPANPYHLPWIRESCANPSPTSHRRLPKIRLVIGAQRHEQGWREAPASFDSLPHPFLADHT